MLDEKSLVKEENEKRDDPNHVLDLIFNSLVKKEQRPNSSKVKHFHITDDAQLFFECTTRLKSELCVLKQ